MSDTSTRISRRSALKRIGAGAALAWSAPTLTTLGSSALAQTTPACGPCSTYTCGDEVPVCGTDQAQGPCLCNQSSLGNCECWADAVCDFLEDCGAGPGFACDPGFVCMSTCCDQEGGFALKCVPLCGTTPPDAPIGSAPLAAGGVWTTRGLKL